MTKIYSERLREVRTYHGYSQREVAEILNVKRSVYTEWEIYKSTIPLKHLIKLADFYKINIDYLLGLTNKQSKVSVSNIDTNIICARLINIRKELELTTREFARVLHVSNSTITRYEKGVVLISTSVCYNIARSYSISVDYILGRSNIKYFD